MSSWVYFIRSGFVDDAGFEGSIALVGRGFRVRDPLSEDNKSSRENGLKNNNYCVQFPLISRKICSRVKK
jgi:hypothetical protein